MVMISGLVAVSGLASQSPNWVSTTRPVPASSMSSSAFPMNLKVLWLTLGSFQVALWKVWENETVLPLKGTVTLRLIRT